MAWNELYGWFLHSRPSLPKLLLILLSSPKNWLLGFCKWPANLNLTEVHLVHFVLVLMYNVLGLRYFVLGTCLSSNEL